MSLIIPTKLRTPQGIIIPRAEFQSHVLLFLIASNKSHCKVACKSDLCVSAPRIINVLLTINAWLRKI